MIVELDVRVKLDGEYCPLMRWHRGERKKPWCQSVRGQGDQVNRMLVRVALVHNLGTS